MFHYERVDVKVLVLGGYGAVGRHITDRLRSDGITALAAGRDPSRADLIVDLADLGSYGRALDGIDVVVNSSGAEDVRLAQIAANRSIPFVDISATSAYTRELERIAGPVLIGVGIAPGLSGVLARESFSVDADEIDIAVGLGAGEKHGAAATEWTYGLLGRQFHDPDGTTITNFTRGKSIDFPAESGYRRFASLRADFADQHRLTRELGIPVRTYLRLDSRVMTLGLAALTRMPWAARLSPSTMPGGDRWAIVARGNNGRSAWATGREQSVATAAVAAWSASALAAGDIELRAASWMHSVATLRDLALALTRIGCEVTAG